MNKLSVVLAVLLVGCATNPQPVSMPDPVPRRVIDWTRLRPASETATLDQSLFERLVSSTVVISTESGGASGVLVKHDGKWYAWTAAHVAGRVGLELDSATVTARIFDQGNVDERYTGPVMRVIAIDTELDLAVLEVDLPDLKFNSVSVNLDELQLGQEIFNCGNYRHKAQPWRVSKGLVSQSPGENLNGKEKDGRYLGTDIVAAPGCSGSGIFNSKSELVGILIGDYGAGATVFIHNTMMEEFAKAHGIEWALGR